MKRDKRITFRLSESEEKSVKYRATRSKMTVGKYCRFSALNKDIQVVEGLEKLLPELNRIGNNINQIAYQMNSHQIVNPDLKYMQYSLNMLLETVYQILERGDESGDFETSEQEWELPF